VPFVLFGAGDTDPAFPIRLLIDVVMFAISACGEDVDGRGGRAGRAMSARPRPPWVQPNW